ncbi:DUF4355 domain-containing protein [Enterococcus casseliflavus]|uniref:DUF4355 domain-containing protein n=2 Tax=Enterococcus casseliflavus TaxID=37734 RepID=A0ABD6Z4C7_ENTCA|nr:DUF4355 domain-containing protein [Enterococcus casseliflavus]EOH79257.1 hypothetical protein UAM_02781 [Enterococcus casseliflavus ATCC 49996]EOU08936.1 hypothetical protein I582_02100 [Enterococcus casseliflavus ATCC 49996]MDT2972870.1 DUF4355 domain-containing protein [Enterococcus casseliflavus]QGN31284.1 DUF4355 domain-containing protein [Enterococcus casseliflavus]QQB85358.1 DUF4355 domain-containing protein [Enterococcus casseliflavus]
MQANKLLVNQFVGQSCSNRLMKMKLQFFADGGEGDGAEGGQNGESGNGENKPISFSSQSEFDSVVDKRISKAIETAQAKWQTEAEKRIQDAEKKGQMSAEEKAQYELQQERERLEADRVALKRDKDETSVIKRLSTDKLPDSLSTVLAPLFGGDEKNLDEAYGNVSKAFREAVEQAVNIRLAGSADNPAGNGGGSDAESIGSQYAKNANSRTKADNDNFWK